MSSIELLSPAVQTASTPLPAERADAGLFSGMLDDGAGQRPVGRLGSGRQIRAQSEAAAAATGQDAMAAMAASLAPILVNKPLVDTGADGSDGASVPQLNSGLSAGVKSDQPQINPGQPTLKDDVPLINPGEPAAKPQGPQINPGEPGLVQTGAAVSSRPGTLDAALQALSARDQINAINTLALAARQAVGRAPEGGLATVKAAAEPATPALDADALLTSDHEATAAPAGPTTSGTAAASAQVNAIGADPSVQDARARDARPEAELSRLGDADVAPQEVAPEPLARPVAADAVAPGVAHRVDVSAVRLGMDAVAQLSAQIIRRLDGRATRFDIELNPVELGRVDVRLDIDAEGRLAARLAFDNPAAAVELRSRVDELRRDLQQAGFHLADDAFSFTDRGGSDRNQAQQGDGGRLHVRSAEIATEIDAAAQPALRMMTRLGLDVRV